MSPKLAAALLLVAVPALAQQTGVSHPPDTLAEDMPQASAPSQVTPPAADAAPVAEEAPIAARPAPVPICTTPTQVTPPAQSSVVLHTRPMDPETAADSGIVTSVPVTPGELAAGTQIHARLLQEIGTDTTEAGTPFAATLTQDVAQLGRVYFPQGSTLRGRVTRVRGGHRIRGAALIHLQVQSITLPDGTVVPLHAEVIDTDQWNATRVDEEGNIIRKDHVGETLTAMSLTTGSAAAAGSVVGAGVGALVGAGIGAGASTVWWLKQDRQAHLPEGTMLTLSLSEPMSMASLESHPYARPAEPVARVAAPAPPMPAEPQAFVPTN